ncbi:carbohydrate ABC transporter permease [Micromonospora tulbaghiae]|uniref:carbohydrate ABC transporter permease n=1 Tax=Micromonospora tulbaghiae TaxID=479978 RepID=UPI0033318AC1
MTTVDTGAPAAETTRATAPADRPPRRELGVANVFSHGFLLLWAAMTVLPLAWMVLSSLKTNGEIIAEPWGLPEALRFDNWSRAWTGAHIGRFFFNSLVVVAGSLSLTMLLGATAAYVFARYEFRGRQVVYYLFVGGMMFPVFLALVPLFFVVRSVGLLGTWPGLILVYTAYSLPFTVFFLSAFFRTLPTSVAEAALIDGCGHFRLFFRVMLPMARPGLISVGIFNFLSHWNQFLLPQVLLPGDGQDRMLAQGLSSLAVSQGYAGDYAQLFAGLTIAVLPVLVVYVAFQRQVQSGLTAGQLK